VLLLKQKATVSLTVKFGRLKRPVHSDAPGEQVNSSSPFVWIAAEGLQLRRCGHLQSRRLLPQISIMCDWAKHGHPWACGGFGVGDVASFVCKRGTSRTEGNDLLTYKYLQVPGKLQLHNGPEAQVLMFRVGVFRIYANSEVRSYRQ
jgi:hypothetical protein